MATIFNKIHNKYIHYVYDNSQFTIEYDPTDHFEFKCKCGKVAKIKGVTSADVKTDIGRVYFYFYCDDCKKVGVRKIYLRGM